jgi:hypothetical protein
MAARKKRRKKIGGTKRKASRKKVAKRTRKTARKTRSRKKSSRKKASRKGRIPLSILEKRYAKLGKTIRSRGGRA